MSRGLRGWRSFGNVMRELLGVMEASEGSGRYVRLFAKLAPGQVGFVIDDTSVTAPSRGLNRFALREKMFVRQG